MPTDPGTIGEQLRLARVDAGLRLRELAGAVGISARELSDIEHSRTLPTVMIITAILAALPAWPGEDQSPTDTLGARLRQARIDRGHSQSRLAYLLRLTRRPSLSHPFARTSGEDISRYERDGATPERPTLFALAKVLRCSVAWLENGPSETN